MNNSCKGDRSIGIHFFYVSLILASIIVVLASVKWSDLPKFTDYLSAAATITSLVLGLLAIIYAYISNDSLSKATGVVSEVANKSQESAIKIASLLSLVDGVVIAGQDTNLKLSGILDDLRAQINSLDGTASTLDHQVAKINEVLPEIPKGLDALGRRFEEFVQAAPVQEAGSTATSLSTENMGELASLCVAQSSPAGLFVMYACWLGKKTGKKFNVKSLSDDFSSADYVYGFFVAISSIDLINITKHEEPWIVTIDDCPNEFERCKEKFFEKLNKLKTEAGKRKWRTAIEALEKLFEED